MPPGSPERLSLKPKNSFKPSTNSTMGKKEDSIENQVDKENDLPALLPGDSFQLVSPDDMLVVSTNECQQEVICPSENNRYEEMIHDVDEQIVEEHEQMEDAPEEEFDDDLELNSSLITLTQWALILQEVYEDQLKLTSNKCQCSKATFLEKEFRKIQSSILCCENQEKNLLDEMSKLLKTNISIQISRPNVDVSEKSQYLVSSSANPTQYTNDVIDSLIRLIQDICQVNNCKHCCLDSSDSIADGGSGGVMEQDEEEDMSNLVASMSTCSESSRNRKRKQILPKSKSPPHSPTSSPSKKPRKGRSFSLGGSVTGNNNPFHVRPFHKSSNVIDILEKNKKMAKTNGLYQFVLWREALKAEEDRAPENKRLSFD